jgi:CBS domain-containing protein
MAIEIRNLLERKGSTLVRVGPRATLADAVRLLGQHDIGVVVVMPVDSYPMGILSERDIVRALASRGTTAMTRLVTHHMTSPVLTCTPEDTTDDVMHTMTRNRVRHLPVVDRGRPVGMVSMRDVVESYVTELEVATVALSQYVTGGVY